MTKNTFILIAIDGGWEPCDFSGMPLEHRGVLFPATDDSVKEAERLDYIFYDTEYPEEGYYAGGTFEAALLDPEAWKAVGKVEEWKRKVWPTENKPEELPYTLPGWQYAMHRMVDALADGKNVEDFLATL